LLNEPLKEGAAKGQVVELEEMLDEYYGFRGWSNDGMPSEKKILEVGLLEERGSM
jgi:aldehyde:ferredoxin oxidoreductase